MKKLLSTVFCLSLVLAAFVFLPTQASAATEGYYTYTVSDGVAIITDVSTSISGDITIPSNFGFYSVTGIDPWAFSGCSGLTSVTIPDSITSISFYAFYDCDSLTSVKIPDSLTYIGGSAFYDCDNLTDIVVSNDNPSYSTDARGVLFNKDKTTLILAPCGITGSYTIPNSVISIESDAFDSCYNLTSVSIPDSVTSIGDYAFSSCCKLTSMIIPDSVTDIGGSVFCNCDNLELVVIPNSVYSIGSYAFEGCDNLNTLVIGNRVSYIGDYAFDDCEKLTEVCYLGTQEQWDAIQIGSGNEQLTSSELLQSIDSGICGYDYDTGWMKETSWRLYSNGIMIISGRCGIDYKPYTNNPVTSVIITGGVPSIGDSAFSMYSNLTTVAIPSSVTTIGDYAFQGCEQLANVEISCGVTSIGDSAFRSCDSLTSITLPDSVVTIGDYAFYYCANLFSVTIGNGVTSIGDSAFYSCDSLTGITLPDSVTTIGDSTFGSCEKLASVTIGNGVTSIGDSAFSYCYNLTSIVFPDGITSVGNSAFSSSGLTSITLPDSVTSIGDSAFEYCGSITDVTIGDGVNRIGPETFYNCGSLTFVTIGDGVTTIGTSAFYNCNNLTNVYYTGTQKQWDEIQIESGNYKLTSANLTVNYDPDNADSIVASGSCGENLTWTLDDTGILVISGTGAMSDYDCWNSFAPWYDYRKIIQSIIIPEEVTAIGDWAFCGCSGLSEIAIPDSVTSIGDSAFESCGLTSINISDGVTSVGERAFYGCSSLTSVIISKTVTTIGDDTFSFCDSLTGIWVEKENSAYSSDDMGVLFDKDKTILIRASSVLQAYSIPDTVQIIGNRSFNRYENLTSIVIPDGVTSIGDQAFQYCVNLTNITIPDSVTFIDTYAFDSCDSLTSIAIPEGITSIGSYTFGYCGGLTNVVIPVSVTTIDDSAFTSCSSLTDVYYTGTQEQWDAMTIGSYGNDPLLSAKLTVNVHECIKWGEWVVSKQPTFTSAGERCLVCSKCGETLTETIEMLVGKVAQWNIVLQDDFEVKFYLQVSESIVSTAKVRLTTGSETVTYNVSALDKTADGYYLLRAEISAAQMNDFIVVMVMNGREIGSNTTYTVREYCDTILADSSHSQYHALVKAMLHYGAMAQMYFDYDTQNLANDGITDAAKAEVPESAEELIVTDSLNVLDFYGASLVYRDRIAVRYYFTGNTTGLTYIANGKVYTPVSKDGMYYIEIADILPQKLDQQITLTITDTDSNALTVSYGPMNYIVRMNEKGSVELQNLLKALYNYHLAARNLNA